MRKFILERSKVGKAEYSCLIERKSDFQCVCEIQIAHRCTIFLIWAVNYIDDQKKIVTKNVSALSNMSQNKHKKASRKKVTKKNV